MSRLFVAIGFSDEARHALAAYYAAALPPLPGKVVPPQNWHITLRFLGEVGDAIIDRLVYALDVIDKPGPFPLKLSGLGAFPDARRATVLWAGIGAGERELVALAAVAEEAAVHAGLAPEDRPFRPHLSLARVQPPQDVWPWLEVVPEPPVKISVDSIGLFRSHLGGASAEYEQLESFRL